MTAFYVPPPPPSQSAAFAAFSGLLEVTGLVNAGIMQKAVFMPRAAMITASWISGVDGLDAAADGTTIFRLSDGPFDQQVGAAGFDLTLAAGQSRSQSQGSEITIPAGGWLYIFIIQAAGGHYGAQLGFDILWQESFA